MAPKRPPSLERRVPLFLSMLVLTVVGVGSVFAYAEFRALLLRMNQERLASATTLFAGLLSQQLGASEVAYQAVGLRALGALATTGDDWTDPAAAAALDRLEVPDGMRALAFLPDDGPCVGFVREASGGWRPMESCPASPTEEPTTGIRPLRVVDGEPRADMMVRADTDSWSGWIVGVSSLRLTPSGSFYADLIAPGSTFLLGNLDGTVWTGLESVVDGPPDLGEAGQVSFTDEAGTRRTGVLVPLATAPWGILVHRDMATVLAPARTFLYWMLGSGLLLAALASLGAWLASRRVTGPLVEVTRGAEAIAGGQHGLRVPVRDGRSDEVGRLAEAFNTMATKVDDREQTLQEQVRERTRSLEEAMVRLEEAQDQLLRQERLATLGQLAGGVGHELRNPLGVMTNAVYYLETVQPDAPPKVREYLNILKSQVATSEKIVSDLLDFGRVSAPEKGRVEVGPLIEECVARADAGKRLDVRVEVAPGAEVVYADRSQLVQVLVNLLTNAAQAMNGGGAVDVTATPDGARVLLRVTDSGPGIPDDQLERVFEPLVTTKARGIGLGLAVSRMLVAANGAQLRAEQVPEGGASFVLEIPARAPGGDT